MQRVYELIDARFDECVQSARELLAIPSCYHEDESGFPFGRDVEDALQYVMKLSRSMGFECGYVDGYACWAQYGEGEGLVGALAHLDVVPAGSGWTSPAFEPHILDGKLYGRGASDDKGPAIACLYALMAIKESGLKVSKRARIIFGGDEEVGFRDVAYYRKHAEIPDAGFSPDSEFPVVYSEKGIAHLSICADFPPGDGVFIECAESGERANVVPHSALARIAAPESERARLIKSIERSEFFGDLRLSSGERGVSVSALGKSAHAATPWEGDNAALKLLRLLSGLNYSPDQKAMLDAALYLLGPGCDGRGLGVACRDEVSGELTMNLGIMNLGSGKLEFTIDIRYPSTLDFGRIERSIKEMCAKRGFSSLVLEHKKPLYIPKDSALVRTLCGVFRDHTGLSGDPISVGGGTYCRAFDNFVAFGPRFPEEPSLAHGPDEYITLERLKAITKIYANALYELMK